MKPKRIFFIITVVLVSFLSACGPMGSPYYGGQQDPYGYDDSYYDNNYGRRRYDERQREHRRRELERLKNERERLEEERRRLERERKRKERETKRETCPVGFSPSGKKCTSKERKHGCQDLKTPGGLRCIRSAFR